METRDELDRYLDAGALLTLVGGDIRVWWLEASQRSQFPLLSRMAVDILSIPAMSAEVERVFSATKKTISEGRWNLNPTAINGIKCLRSWFRAGYYTIRAT